MKHYLIWSNEHGAWWRPSQWGYTTRLEEAGRYSHREAQEICERANIACSLERPNEVAVLSPETDDNLLATKYRHALVLQARQIGELQEALLQISETDCQCPDECAAHIASEVLERERNRAQDAIEDNN